MAKATKLGIAWTPAHLPNWTESDSLTAFSEIASIASHTSWFGDMSTDQATLDYICGHAVNAGLAIQLNLNATITSGLRDQPLIPAQYPQTFTDPTTRDAFKAAAMLFAAKQPARLIIGTELNYLRTNATEYAAFVSLAGETYQQVKAAYPSLTVATSFAWDPMIAALDFQSLTDFADRVDLFAFTSYPYNLYGAPSQIPSNFYSCLRQLAVLVGRRVGFSEIGWYASNSTEETNQKAFVNRLSALMTGVGEEHLTWALLHDFPGTYGNHLDYVGLRYTSDAKKQAWSAASALVLA